MIEPYGKTLVNQVLEDSKFENFLSDSSGPKIRLTRDDLINIQNIATGSYSPLRGFMTSKEHDSVVASNKLPTGLTWTIPIILPIDEKFLDIISTGIILPLTRSDTETVGLIEVSDVFEIDHTKYSHFIFGTTDMHHPGVQNERSKSPYCIGGEIFLRQSAIVKHANYHSPAEMRDIQKGLKNISTVGFSTRNIPHIGHEYQHNKSLGAGNNLCINVITGAEVKGSFNPEIVFDAYEIMINEVYPENRVWLNNLFLPPFFAGPKEAFLQATIMQNLGFDHFIVGRDHAGVGDFYGKYDAQKIFTRLTDLDIEILDFVEPRFCKDCENVLELLHCNVCNCKTISLNGRDIRRCLLEKRFDDLKLILSLSMQNYLIELSQDRVNFENDVSKFSDTQSALFI